MNPDPMAWVFLLPHRHKLNWKNFWKFPIKSDPLSYFTNEDKPSGFGIWWKVGYLIMTAEEKMKRALAVENMYRLYKKYYPVWIEQKKAEAAASWYIGSRKFRLLFSFWGFPFFVPRVTIV